MNSNTSATEESAVAASKDRLSWVQRLPLIPIFGLQFIGVLIVLFAVWRTPTVVANVRDAWTRATSDTSLAKEGSIVLSIVYGVGVTMFVAGRRLLRWFRGQMVLMEQFPDQPWMYRRDWREKKTVLTNRTATIIAVIGSVQLLLAIPFVQIPAANVSWLNVVSLGMVIIWFAFLRILWLNRHWNQSELQLLTLPGEIGGIFQAVVLIPAVKPLPTELRIELQCVRHRRRSTVPATILWRSMRIRPTSECRLSDPDITTPSDRVWLRVPVSFQIPTDGLEPFNAQRRIFWQLTVRPNEKIHMHEACFEVPVFHNRPRST